MRREYRFYYPTTKEHIVATLKVLAIIACTVAFAFLFCSCQSKSGQLAKAEPEKVVILDSTPRSYVTDVGYTYKVKRFEKGVVDFIYDRRLLEQGDTIFYRFVSYK